MTRDHRGFSVGACVLRAVFMTAILVLAWAPPGASADEAGADLKPPSGLSGWGESRAVPYSLPPLLAQADDEPIEEDFVACAVICQRRLDKQLLNCSGYKNRGEEGRRAPAPTASCRDDAHAAYKSCRSACDERWPGNREKYPS